MKITRRQIEDGFVRQVEASAENVVELLEHKNSKSNPHKVNAAQTGTYSAAEIDAQHEAIMNLSYGKAYWYGRKFSATPWPLPPAGETWPRDDRDGFDFETAAPWYWDGEAWVEKAPLKPANGMVVGVSREFLDIVDFGFPGLARYSEATESWDFYPNKYNEMDSALFMRNKEGKETLKDYSIKPKHLANPIMLLEGDVTAARLPEGVYRGEELKVLNDADTAVELFSGEKTISIQLGEILELRWNGNEWRVKTDKLVGDFLEQLPAERSPKEKCLEGEWLDWSGRAVIYGLREEEPPDFTDYFKLRELKPVIAANQRPYVCYHLKGSDWQIFQFKGQASAYTIPEDFEPVKWERLEIKPENRVIREACQKLSKRNLATREIVVPDDLVIGDQVTEGIHAGKYVAEVLVLGGKFVSVEGGNRPTFINGGVAPDVIRDIIGRLDPRGTNSAGANNGGSGSNGAFGKNNTGTTRVYANSDGSDLTCAFDFSANRVVPTGPENSSRTLSSRKWRRVV